jgi:hypothetical protein
MYVKIIKMFLTSTSIEVTHSDIPFNSQVNIYRFNDWKSLRHSSTFSPHKGNGKKFDGEQIIFRFRFCFKLN